MKLNYRNSKNANAMATYWSKPLNKPDWYSIQALAEDTVEIFIYDVIGWPYNDVGELVRAMAGIKDKPILARINSPGGDIFDGMALFNAFVNHPGGVTTRIESLAASAASVLAMAGKKVEAYKNTMLMIHNAWVFAIGDQNALREIADLLEKIDGNILDIYTGKTKTGKKDMKQMMDEETWMTAQEAKDKGFIDTILTSGKAAKAQFDLSIFAHVPDDFVTDDNREPTIRDLEKALRDAGLSKNSAKAVLARGWKGGSAEAEVILSIATEIKKNIATLGG